MNQKTDFNNWSISYLRDIIFECRKCKKRNTIVLSSNNATNATNATNINLKENETRQPTQSYHKQFQHCLYCGNPNYV
jgi:hypothetical protein